MSKNDSQKFSDEQLDRLIKTVVQSTILTDEEIDKIAAAPQLRRQILNRISEEKSRRENRSFFALRWQTAAAGAMLFLVVTSVTIWFVDSSQTEIAAVPNEKSIFVSENKYDSYETKTDVTQPDLITPGTTISTTRQKNLPVKTEKNLSKLNSLERAAKAPQKSTKVKTAPFSPKAETATEFIALSYLPASESGQVVRVKVPRSMLVSLGVSTNVERSKEFVNAEVIVGDDGAARAIRFLNE
jgi:hypothetical protein